MIATDWRKLLKPSSDGGWAPFPSTADPMMFLHYEKQLVVVPMMLRFGEVSLLHLSIGAKRGDSFRLATKPELAEVREAFSLHAPLFAPKYATLKQAYGYGQGESFMSHLVAVACQFCDGCLATNVGQCRPDGQWIQRAACANCLPMLEESGPASLHYEGAFLLLGQSDLAEMLEPYNWAC